MHRSIPRPWRIASVLVGLLVSAALAAEPVKLAPYPQKIRTFFALDAAAVPAAVRDTAGASSDIRAADGAIWSGSQQGLTRVDDKAPARDRLQYFAGLRYLPDDDVRGIVPDATGGVWVRTRTGVSHIELRPMTLAQKAEVMEQNVRLRHDRYGKLGDSRLDVPGDLSANRHVDNDNNGLRTSIYAAAESFRHAVTKSPEALG